MEDIKKVLANLWQSWTTVKTVLENLWLNDNEINVYLSSLSTGANTASILGKKAWINRSTAQYTCQSLVNKRVMTMVEKWNSYVFSPEDPEKLIYLLNREITKIQKKKEGVEKIMWDLKILMNPVGGMPKIKYYQWVDGVIEILEDALRERHNIYSVLNINDDINPEIRNYVLNEYIKERTRFTNKSFCLLNDNQETREYSKLDHSMNRTSMLVPEDSFVFKAYMQIYWNKVAFFSFVRNNLAWMIIEDSQIKDSQFSLFKMSWEMAKKYAINKKNWDITL